MKRATVLQHVEVEGPGRIGELLQDRGYTLRCCLLRAAHDVPDDIGESEPLIVMGGPMGVVDVGSTQHPFLEAEVVLLQQRIAQDAPVLGVCLGAQLLAHAAGAKVAPMRATDGTRAYEVGWGPLFLHHQDASELLAGLPARAEVVHWHGDAFELPPHARQLASSELCVQGFQLGRRLFGLQFHCELDAAQIEDFLRVDHEYVITANGAGGVERIRAESANKLPAFRELGTQLLGRMLDAMNAS